jgi:hypothetical protein
MKGPRKANHKDRKDLEEKQILGGLRGSKAA